MKKARVKFIAKFISHLNNLYSTSNTKNGFSFTDTKIRNFAKKKKKLTRNVYFEFLFCLQGAISFDV